MEVWMVIAIMACILFGLGVLNTYLNYKGKLRWSLERKFFYAKTILPQALAVMFIGLLLINTVSATFTIQTADGDGKLVMSQDILLGSNIYEVNGFTMFGSNLMSFLPMASYANGINDLPIREFSDRTFLPTIDVTIDRRVSFLTPNNESAFIKLDYISDVDGELRIGIFVSMNKFHNYLVAEKTITIKAHEVVHYIQITEELSSLEEWLTEYFSLFDLNSNSVNVVMEYTLITSGGLSEPLYVPNLLPVAVLVEG